MKIVSNEQPPGPSIIQEEAESEAARIVRLRDAVRVELSQITDRAAASAQVARRQARFWSRMYFVVGLPAAILATVAGATALASDLTLFAGITALVAGALATAATFLDSATRQTSCNNLAAGWQVLSTDAHMRLVVDVDNDNWLVRDARGCLEDLASRERKLLEGKAPDAEAEAERRAEIEKIRAQVQAARAEAMADQARAAEQLAKLNAEEALRGRTLAAVIKADTAAALRAADTAAQSKGPSEAYPSESPEVKH